MTSWRGWGATLILCVPSRLRGGPITMRLPQNAARVPMTAGRRPPPPPSGDSGKFYSE
jgi:hypothetical protein